MHKTKQKKNLMTQVVVFGVSDILFFVCLLLFIAEVGKFFKKKNLDMITFFTILLGIIILFYFTMYFQ